MAEIVTAARIDPKARLLAILAAALAALPLLRLIPGWLALALIAVGALAAWTSGRRPWPGPFRFVLTLSLAGLVLAAFGFGFGRDTGSALLLAMLALKLSESASLRDARSLIGFALFALFAAFLQDQGPLTLGLALIAVAVVVAALAYLAEYESGLIAPAGLGQRLRQALLWLALALPLALAGFWFYPRLASPLWGVPENALARTGISGTMAPGDWLDILVDDRPAFRARFTGAEPERRQLYWRGPVLWDFDGRAWTRPPWAAAGAPAELEGGRVAFEYQITQEASDRRYLFALDLPLEAPEGGRLGVDLSPYSEQPVRTLKRYGLRAAVAGRFQPRLPDPVRQATLRLPAGFNPRSTARARQWRQQADSDRAYIERVLDWFNRELSYSLTAPPLGRHTSDEFLFDTLTGYCEHFSSAFAILMRAAGIPARVVTGYVGGYRNPFGDYWLIQQSDAHAWVEVWLPETGWLRLDPTAAVDPSRVFERYGEGLGAGALGQTLGGTFAPMSNAMDWLRQGWNQMALGFDATRQQLLLTPLGIAQANRWQLLSVFAVTAALAIGFALWGLNRQRPRRRDDPLLAAWRQLCRRLAKLGLGKRPSESAGRFAQRAAAHLEPDSANKLLSVSQGFVILRYAEPIVSAGDLTDMAADMAAFRPKRNHSAGEFE